MERVLQYWDELDDLVGVIAAYTEQLRRILLLGIACLLLAGLLAAGVLLAFVKPPLALAIATLLSVVLMYRSVTNPPRRLAAHG